MNGQAKTMADVQSRAANFQCRPAAARGWLARLAGAAIAVTALAGMSPQAQADDYAAINFGPAGTGARASTSDSYDREFVREWEANPPKGFATLSKANIEATKAAIKQYTDIVAAGGWGTLPEVPLQAGSSDPSVRLLRLRLAASGDLKDDDTTSPGFDGGLEKAVKRFQAANGLSPTGVVDKRTIGALNVPADARLKQLKVNLGRLQSLVSAAGKKYIVVNIPPPRSRRSRTARSWPAMRASSAKSTARRRSCSRPSRI